MADLDSELEDAEVSLLNSGLSRFSDRGQRAAYLTGRLEELGLYISKLNPHFCHKGDRTTIEEQSVQRGVGNASHRLKENPKYAEQLLMALVYAGMDTEAQVVKTIIDTPENETLYLLHKFLKARAAQRE